MTEDDIEREQVEAVFCLSGGELDAPDDTWGPYHYDGQPYYIPDPPDMWSESIAYRTIVACELYGAARIPVGWTRVDHWTSSGETECYCKDGCEEHELPFGPAQTCPLCDGGGFIYIGDGWREILCRTDTDYEHAPLAWLLLGLLGCLDLYMGDDDAE